MIGTQEFLGQLKPHFRKEQSFSDPQTKEISYVWVVQQNGRIAEYGFDPASAWKWFQITNSPEYKE